eukprot:363399-Chlamydomonas_euryale.AAC.7
MSTALPAGGRAQVRMPQHRRKPARCCPACSNPTPVQALQRHCAAAVAAAAGDALARSARRRRHCGNRR